MRKCRNLGGHSKRHFLEYEVQEAAKKYDENVKNRGLPYANSMSLILEKVPPRKLGELLKFFEREREVRND